MEKILVIKRNLLPSEFVEYEVSMRIHINRFIKVFSNKTEWLKREKAENNPKRQVKKNVSKKLINFI